MNDSISHFSEWQRLSPWSIVYFIARTIKGFLDPNILVMAAPLYGLYQFFDNSTLFIILSATLIPLGIILYAIISYLFFTFRLEQDKMLVKKGMLFKRRIELPFERIQDIHIEKPFYFKPLGLVSAAVDTAGSNQQEAVLAAVTYDQATQFREIIVHKKQAEPTETNQEADSAPSPNEKNIILTRSPKDLVIHGLSNNKAWIIFAAIFPLMDRIMESMANNFFDAGLYDIARLSETSWTAFSGTLIIGILLLISAMLLLSIAGSFIVLFNYQLSKGEDSFSRESGLFSRHQVNLKLRRLQYISFKQGPIDRCFNRLNLYFNQVSSQQGNTQEQRQTFMVPSITAGQATELCQEAFNDFDLNHSLKQWHFTPISKRFIWQQFTRIIAPILFLATAFLILENRSHQLLTFLPLILALGSGLVFLRWKKWGYMKANGFYVIRRGLFGTVYEIFPPFKAQQAFLKQSFFMARNQHCNWHTVIGSNSLKVPYIPLNQGTALLDKTIYDVENSRRSWM